MAKTKKPTKEELEAAETKAQVAAERKAREDKENEAKLHEQAIKDVFERLELDDFAIHPASKIFTPYTKQKLKELTDDIRESGLRESLLAWGQVQEGKPVIYIVDGATRLTALLDIGITRDEIRDKIDLMDVNGDPWVEAAKRNILRRNMNKSQIAMVGARMSIDSHQGFVKSVRPDVTTIKDVVKLLRVSPAYIKQARKILVYGDQQYIDFIDLHGKSVGEVYNAIAKAERIAKREVSKTNLKDKEKKEAAVKDKMDIILTEARHTVEDKLEKANKGKDDVNMKEIDVKELMNTVSEIGSERQKASLTRKGNRKIKSTGDKVELHNMDSFPDLDSVIEAESVDLIFTDWSSDSKFIDSYEDLGTLANHVLKPGGSLIVVNRGFNTGKACSDLSSVEGINYKWILSQVLSTTSNIKAHNIEQNSNLLLWYVKGEFESAQLISSSVVSDDLGLMLGQFLHKGGPYYGGTVLDPVCGDGKLGLSALKLKASKFIGNAKNVDKVRDMFVEEGF